MDGVVAMDIIRDRGPVSRLDVVDSGRRRRFSDEAKLAIVAESYRGPKQVSATARRHGITRFQLNIWRKAHREGRLGAGSWEGFVPHWSCQTLARPWSLPCRRRRRSLPHAAPVGWTLSRPTGGM